MERMQAEGPGKNRNGCSQEGWPAIAKLHCILLSRSAPAHDGGCPGQAGAKASHGQHLQVWGGGEPQSGRRDLAARGWQQQPADRAQLATSILGRVNSLYSNTAQRGTKQ